MPDTETSTGKKRLRASQACLYCRSKRSKCDGSPAQRPCTQCKDKNIKCEFVQGRRNRRYLEDQATALQEENSSLQRALAHARRTSMSMGSTWDTSSTLPLETEATETTIIAPFPEIAAGSFDENEGLWNTDLTFHRADRAPGADLAKEDASSYYSSGPYRQSPNRNALASLTSELPNSTPPQSMSGCRIARGRGNIVTEATEHFLSSCLSKSAIDYLVGLFFTRCMVMLKFIPPSQFLASEDSDTPPRQPSSLLLAIIAAALRYATRADVLAVCFDKDGNNVPAALAKKLLETELLDANIDTVHALLAISEVETSSNNLMSGYMYGSMAVRLLFNLRLHYGSGAETTLTREEALARYWLLWNLSVQDQSWSIELKCPPSIHPSRLRTARELFESRGQSPHEQPEAESFETSVGNWILNLMVIGREITLELYGAPPRSRPALVPKLDTKLRNWLKGVPEDISVSPIGHHFSYHFHFGFHMILHSTWITLHRELADVDDDAGHFSVPIATSWDVINQSATQIAKLFETFRRTDDARFFHASGVQWIGLAVDGLSRYLDRIPIDQAIEPLAHLQSLQRTLKVLSDYFAQAASLHASTAAKTREVVARMDGDFDSGHLPTATFQVPPLPRPKSGPIAHVFAFQNDWQTHAHKASTLSDQTTDVMSNAESQQPGLCPPDWLSHFSEDDMVMGGEGATGFSRPNLASFGQV